MTTTPATLSVPVLSILALAALAVGGCIIDAGPDADTDTAGSTGPGSNDGTAGMADGNDDRPADGADDNSDDNTDDNTDDNADDNTDDNADDDPLDGTDDGELRCLACEVEALEGTCADAAATCEGDGGAQGCSALATCIDRCEDDERCLELCLIAADLDAVTQLDDLLQCVDEACPLCEPIDLDPPDEAECRTCEDEALDRGCADESAACEASLDCLDLVLCFAECDDDDPDCLEPCIEGATKEAIDLVDAIGVCVGEACPLC